MSNMTIDQLNAKINEYTTLIASGRVKGQPLEEAKNLLEAFTNLRIRLRQAQARRK